MKNLGEDQGGLKKEKLPYEDLEELKNGILNKELSDPKMNIAVLAASVNVAANTPGLDQGTMSALKKYPYLRGDNSKEIVGSKRSDANGIILEGLKNLQEDNKN